MADRPRNGPSPAEPVTEVRKIPIVESGEPLVDFLEFCPKIVQDVPRFHYKRAHHLRIGVAERLRQASEDLPGGFKLAVVEGRRPLYIQHRMYLRVWLQFKKVHPEWSDHQLKRYVNRFTAPINLKVPPPHSTGAALDVWLLDADGSRLDMNSPYERHDPKGFGLKAPKLSDEAKLHRKVLSETMEGAGITNYPSEYWHYSYGDQGWAYRGGHPNAIYGSITPPGWEPDPNDAVDEPLEFLPI